MLRYCASLVVIVLVWGCENDINLINEITRNKGSEDIVHDVVMHYTDSGKIKVILKTPTISRKPEGTNMIQEFTNGIYCEFYDDSSKLKATLTARYAIRDENKRSMIARDHVKLVAEDGRILESEELNWDEGRQLIFTNKFFKSTMGNEIATGFFFEADQSFKKVKMRRTEADNIVIPGLKK